MSDFHGQQRPQDSARGRPYNYRSSPRMPRNNNNHNHPGSPAPSRSNTTSSRSASPRSNRGGRSPYMRTNDRMGEDSANHQWRAWRGPEETTATAATTATTNTPRVSFSSTSSPSNRLSPALTSANASSSASASVTAANNSPRPTASPAASISRDILVPQRQQTATSPMPVAGSNTASNTPFSSNAITSIRDEHDDVVDEAHEVFDDQEGQELQNEEEKRKPSIWSDDWDDGYDEEQLFPTNYIPPDTTAGGNNFINNNDNIRTPPRSGWSPEPTDKFDDVDDGPVKTHLTYFFTAKRENRDLSIDDICVRVEKIRGPQQQQQQQQQHHQQHEYRQYDSDDGTFQGPQLRRGAPVTHHSHTITASATSPTAGSNSRFFFSPPPTMHEPNVQVLTDTSSPFMYPQFFGKPPPQPQDNYQQQQNNGSQATQNRGNKRWLNDNTMNANRYPEYISSEEIELGVANDELHVGILRISRSRRYDAYVSVASLDDDVYVGSELSRNRAFDGDIVAIRLKDVEAAWKQRKEAHQRFLARKGATVDRNPSAADLAEEEEEEESGGEEEEETLGYKPKYAAEVVGIVERPKERFVVGFLNIDYPNEGNSIPEHRLWFRPLDKRTPLCYIPNANGPPDIIEKQDQYKSQLLVAKVIGWQSNKIRPVAKIMRVLGEVGDMAVETEAILADCSIIATPYSEAALSAVPSLPFTIPEAEFSKRSDMREILTFTIDPSTAKDLDDALHIKRLVDGFEVGVHIADVSYFVKANTPLDSEAKERGTSTYLVDRVVPMLPEALCQELCSLKAGEDRLAFSIIWKMDKEARVLDTSFCKTIIRSKTQLSYEDAQKVIDGGNLDSSIERVAEIEQAIRDLMELARCRRRRRFGEGGALALDSIKLMFDVDANGEPTAAIPQEHIETHSLVEEFMLQANISAAKKISTAYPNEALLRRHQGPIIRRMNQFVEQAQELGFDIKAETSGELQQSFASVPEGAIKQALLALAIRPMQRAKYFCVGTLDDEKWLHYALNEPVYTHFTSPIRRYADIIVHRQLEAAMNSKKWSGYSKKTTQSISYHCNYRKERAGAAEDLSIHLFLSRYLANMASKGPIIEPATVIDVELDYIDIYHHKYGLKRRLYVEDLPVTKYEFDSDSNTVTWYWKQGALVDMESYMKRVNKYSSNSSRRQQRGASTNGDAVEGSTPPTKQVDTQLRAPPRELVPSRLDHEACTQTFAVFSTLEVRLQVNSSRSPPVINAYPVNPFY